MIVTGCQLPRTSGHIPQATSDRIANARNRMVIAELRWRHSTYFECTIRRPIHRSLDQITISVFAYTVTRYSCDSIPCEH